MHFDAEKSAPGWPRRARPVFRHCRSRSRACAVRGARKPLEIERVARRRCRSARPQLRQARSCAGSCARRGRRSCARRAAAVARRRAAAVGRWCLLGGKGLDSTAAVRPRPNNKALTGAGEVDSGSAVVLSNGWGGMPGAVQAHLVGVPDRRHRRGHLRRCWRSPSRHRAAGTGDLLRRRTCWSTAPSTSWARSRTVKRTAGGSCC